MKASRGEIKICDILDNAGISYEEEYSFPDLVSSKGHPLRFDFAILDDDGNLICLIEYQGIQHYEAISRFGGYPALRKQKYYDLKKVEYCQKHNIKLLCIPYWDEYKIDFDYIFSAIERGERNK